MNEQRSPEWHADRAGKFTGSKFVDVMARNKKTGEPLKAYHDLVWQVVVERMTGQPVEGPTAAALQWGEDVEPFAREAYELETGNVVIEAGFIPHPTLAFAGASPDGLIGEDGGLEMKCPKNPAIHLERFINGLPDEYYPQIQGCMWVTGRKWWDFVSFDPRMPESHRLLRIRVERDDAYIQRLEAAVIEAEARVAGLLGTLLAEGQPEPAPSFGAIIEIAKPKAAPPPEPEAAVALSAEDKAAVVVEHQDEIATFMASREWGKDARKVRPILVEFVKFQAERRGATAGRGYPPAVEHIHKGVAA